MQQTADKAAKRKKTKMQMEAVCRKSQPD